MNRFAKRNSPPDRERRRCFKHQYASKTGAEKADSDARRHFPGAFDNDAAVSDRIIMHSGNFPCIGRFMTESESTVHFGRELAQLPPGIAALIGGGGKTSLLFALGRYLASENFGTLCTTTTRLAQPAADQTPPFAFHADPETIHVAKGETLLAVRPALAEDDPGKVRGYTGAEIDALFKRRAADWILVEADGSAGRPLKAPARHEPVLPLLAHCVVAVVGLGCLGKPFSPDTVFRTELASAITRLQPCDAITPHAAASIVTHPRGLFHNTPEKTPRILFCNQTDLPDATEGGRELIRRVAAERPGFLHAAYIGSIAKDGLSCLRLPAS